MTPEANFRHNRVDPFLKKLKNCVDFSIQQVAINGTPDKFLCLNGLFIGMELKSATGDLKKLQEYNRDRIISVGKGLAWEVKPQNWEEVKQYLLAIDRGEKIYGQNQ